MTILMPYAIALAALLVGLAIGAAVVAWPLRREPKPQPEPEPLDEWTAAAIDQAAVSWVRANHLPDEAAGPVADKLRLLHKLGSERGWN